MKNVSEIASALRNEGFKFGQTKLMAALASYEPAVKHGRFAFYDDSVYEQVLAVFEATYPKKKAVELPIQSLAEPEDSVDLVSIRRMLEAICSELNITVAA